MSGTVYCCVDGCSNIKSRNRELTFYSFPGYPWEVQKRIGWIKAIGKDPSWKPKTCNRVCSAHFVGGRQSYTESSPAYIPTIFPPKHGEKVKDPKLGLAALARHERHLKRQYNIIVKKPTVSKPPEEAVARQIVDDLKKKWRGLRDTFGRELKKSETDKGPESSWPPYKDLMFLKDTMSRRVSYLSPTLAQKKVKRLDEVVIKIEEDGSKEKNEDNSKSIKPVEGDSKRLRSKEDTCNKEGPNDPDAQFLMSLLPFLKDIPKHRKLIVRAKLQQVLIDEQDPNIIIGKEEESLVMKESPQSYDEDDE